MLATKVFRYRDPAAVPLGLGELRRQGLTPRGILFLALDGLGETHLAIPDDVNEVTKIKVGEKLALKPPWGDQRLYHFDAIHRLPSGGVLWNGDRRLAQPGSASEVAVGVAEWVKGSGAKNVFLGCTPHQPGSWWSLHDRSPVVALHDKGFVDVVTTATGLVARRIGEPRLYYVSYPKFALGPLEGWQPIFEGSLGNILLLERRVLADRLVATCERGLVEVDLSALPAASESAKVELASGFGIVGRIDGGAFAVTSGTVEPWGLADVAPALLVGAQGDTLRDLARSLSKKS
jgi:hypothetical protein